MDIIYILLALLVITIIGMLLYMVKTRENIIKANKTSLVASRASKNNYRESYLKAFEEATVLRKGFKTITNNLDEVLYFVTPDDAVARNVKVKTFIEEDGTIHSTFTIRKMVNKKWKDIEVIPKLQGLTN